jgi:HD-GYP domain-containing protein (c-di-GMP phosphodiesterase class II)
MHFSDGDGGLQTADRPQLLLGLLVERLPFGLLLLDAAGRVEQANARFAELCDCPLERLVGLDALRELPVLAELGLAAAVAGMQRTGEDFILDQTPGVAFTGTPRFLRFSGRCLREGGELAGYAVLVEDMAALGDPSGRLKSSLGQLRRVMVGAVEAMSTMVERRDPFVAGHQRRVAQLAVALGAELELDAFQIEGLRIMALLHDIGKVAVPAEILCKPARLSPAERAIVRRTPQTAQRILKRVEFPWPVAEAIGQHQERLDGSGYPDGLQGEEILLQARILAVADTVEAMLTHRPYRPAHPLPVVLAELETQRGRQLDARVVDACLGLFQEKGFMLEAI